MLYEEKWFRKIIPNVLYWKIEKSTGNENEIHNNTSSIKFTSQYWKLIMNFFNRIKNVIEYFKIVDKDLLRAITNNDLSFVINNMSRVVDIDERIFSGNTPLIEAVNSKSWDVVQYLIGAGANVNLPNREGSYPIHFAATNLDTISLTFLINANVDCDVKDKDITALEYSILENKNTESKAEFVRLLLSAGCNKDIDYNGMSALMLAAARKEYIVVEELLKHGAIIHKSINDEKDIVWYSLSVKDLRLFHLLVEYGANIDIRSDDGTTSIMKAAFYNLIDFVKLLINNGANMDATSEDSFNALIIATTRNHYTIVEMLVNAGVELNHKLDNDKSALDFAKMLESNVIYRLLKTAGAIEN